MDHKAGAHVGVNWLYPRKRMWLDILLHIFSIFKLLASMGPAKFNLISFSVQIYTTKLMI